MDEDDSLGGSHSVVGLESGPLLVNEEEDVGRSFKSVLRGRVCTDDLIHEVGK